MQEDEGPRQVARTPRAPGMDQAWRMVDRVMAEVQEPAMAAIDGLDAEDAEEVICAVLERLVTAYVNGAKVIWSTYYLEMLKATARRRRAEVRRRFDAQLATAIEEWVEREEAGRDVVLWRLKAVRMPCRGLLETWVAGRSGRPRLGCVRQFAWVLKDPPPQEAPRDRPAAGRTRDLAK